MNRVPCFRSHPSRRPTVAAWCLLAFLLSPGFSRFTGAAAAEPATPPSSPRLTNRLGMQFVALPGSPVWLSIWETRVQDFAAFVAATGYAATEGAFSLGTNRWKQRGDHWQSPGFPQTNSHAVCAVSWEDAKAFCAWLSREEGVTYRLPTDAEWSTAVGLGPEPGTSPHLKDEIVRDRYPWGTEFPPVRDGKPLGNFAGFEASETNWPANFRTIEAFQDPFPRTAPVGRFPPNRFGFHDLGGNVWEWCEDLFEPGKDYRVVRGGSWVDNLADMLLASNRHYGRPNLRNVTIGFRCVRVADTPPR